MTESPQLAPPNGGQAQAPENPRERYHVQATSRAVNILFSLTDSDLELSLREIAARTGLTKATAFRLLATLQAHELIDQDPATGFYRLGSGITTLAAARARQGDLLYRSLPSMRALRDQVNETVCLAVRVGDFRLQLHQIESRQPLHRSNQTGKRSPLYAGAANVLLLAAMDDVDIETYLARTELIAFTPSTIVSSTQLWARIGEIRKQGFAISMEESHLQGASVAAPIRDVTGEVVGTVYLSVPLTRFLPDARDLFISATTVRAYAISRELGYRRALSDGPLNPPGHGQAEN